MENNRIKQLPVGFTYNGTEVREVEILRSNGIAERVFTDKLPEKPYTWMGNCLAASIKSIAGEPVAEVFRKEYLETRSGTIPQSLLSISIADLHTILMEIHRTAWRPVIKKQEAICKYCGTKMIVDIDLNKIDFFDDEKLKLGRHWPSLSTTLKVGYAFAAFGKPGDPNRMYEELDGLVFNKFTFRIPNLRDGIRNEDISDDSVLFWRKLAYDTLIAVERVENNEVVAEVPKEALLVIGQKLFDVFLDSEDLQAIRELLREELPTLPFYYLAECVSNRCKRMTPIVMESSSFFAD